MPKRNGLMNLLSTRGRLDAKKITAAIVAVAALIGLGIYLQNNGLDGLIKTSVTGYRTGSETDDYGVCIHSSSTDNVVSCAPSEAECPTAEAAEAGYPKTEYLSSPTCSNIGYIDNVVAVPCLSGTRQQACDTLAQKTCGSTLSYGIQDGYAFDFENADGRGDSLCPTGMIARPLGTATSGKLPIYHNETDDTVTIPNNGVKERYVLSYCGAYYACYGKASNEDILPKNDITADMGMYINDTTLDEIAYDTSMDEMPADDTTTSDTLLPEDLINPSGAPIPSSAAEANISDSDCADPAVLGKTILYANEGQEWAKDLLATCRSERGGDQFVEDLQAAETFIEDTTNVDADITDYLGARGRSTGGFSLWNLITSWF